MRLNIFSYVYRPFGGPLVWNAWWNVQVSWLFSIGISFFLLVCGSPSNILDTRFLSVLANVLPILKLGFSFQVSPWADFQFIPAPSRQPFEVQTHREGVHHQAGPGHQSCRLNPRRRPSLWVSQLLPWNLCVFSGVQSLRLTSLGPSLL